MKKILFLIYSIAVFFPIIVNAATCPDSYDLKGEWCVKYTNTVTEANQHRCMQGSKVTIDGKVKCEVKVKPTTEEQKTNQSDTKKEESNTSNKDTVDCKADSNKVCKCEDGYDLEGNLCVKYTDSFKEFNQWHCTQGSKVTKDGSVKCKITATPKLEAKKSVANNQTSGKKLPEGYAFCYDDGVLKTFMLVGYMLKLIKVLIPLLLIIFGSIDFGKAAIAGDDKGIQTASRMLVIRAAAGVIIFFIPTIMFFFTGLIGSWSKLDNEFDNCRKCLLGSVKQCETARLNSCKSNTNSKQSCSWDSNLDTCYCKKK